MNLPQQSSYMIIQDSYQDDLIRRVNDAIENGYRISGGVSTYIDDDGIIMFCQAVVKYKGNHQVES